MDPQIVNKISEEPDSKRPKLDHEEEKREESSSSSDDSMAYDSDDVRMYEEELKRHGEYDFDCSRVGRVVGYRPVIFEDSDFADEPETDGELINRLSKTALDKYNQDKGNNLEFVKAVKSNWSIGGGHIFSITFEAKDASQSGQYLSTLGLVTFHGNQLYTMSSLNHDILFSFTGDSIFWNLKARSSESRPSTSLVMTFYLVVILSTNLFTVIGIKACASFKPMCIS